MKPYPAYKPSNLPWLGAIPAHWRKGRIKNVLLRNDNGVWGKDIDASGGTIVLRSTEQTVSGEWKIDDPATRLLTVDEFESAKLLTGDLVITKSSGSEQHIGKTSVVTSEVETLNCCFSNFMQRLRVREDVNAYFVRYILNSPIGRVQFVYNSNSTTGLANLNREVIDNVHIGLPPLKEQNAIVAFLDRKTEEIARFIACKRKLIALLHEEKAALVARAVTQGLNPDAPRKPSGTDWLGDVPAHWGTNRAKYYFWEVDKRSEAGKEELLSVSHITGVTRRSEKNITMFMAESYEGYKTCQPGDLVINIMWAWMGALGVSPHAGIVSSAYCVYRQHKGNSFLPEYLDLLLRTRNYIAEFTCRSTGIQESRLRMYTDQFFCIPILQPPFPEQRQIVEYIHTEAARIDQIVRRTEREIELIQEYRATLISEAVTGKMDVRR